MNDMQKARKQKAPPTERHKEIERLSKTPKDKRTPQHAERLAALQGEERRAKWQEQQPRRIERLKKAIRRVIHLGNPRAYQYTPEEAEALCAAVKRYAQEVERAFKGTPKEKGLFDL